MAWRSQIYGVAVRRGSESKSGDNFSCPLCPHTRTRGGLLGRTKIIMWICCYVFPAAKSQAIPPGSYVSGLEKLCKENALCIALNLRQPIARHGLASPCPCGTEGCLKSMQVDLTWLSSRCCQFRPFHAELFLGITRDPPFLPSSPHILEESPLQPAFCAEHHLASLVPIQGKYVTILMAA